ncbi:MAG: biotin transporter BioY [Bacteroidetes bacterium]|nr:biotin biosynthesis protein BioY [Rhodothermaceae bacterium RA]RMH64081.1 MAG: biotin transporter BioY [Bacteroidota bacterium]
MTNLLKLQASQAALVDALRQERASAAVQVLGIVGFALLTALGAQVRLYLWEVPFTLQTLAVYGSGLYLGWRNGGLAQLLYLTLGLFFPVFAGDHFGPAYLFGAVTAGYLLAYPAAAAVVGLLSRRWNSLVGSTLSMLVGSLVFFTLGVVWLHHTADHATWFESIDKGFLRFIPVDLLKITGLGLLYAGTRRLGR